MPTLVQRVLVRKVVSSATSSDAAAVKPSAPPPIKTGQAPHCRQDEKTAAPVAVKAKKIIPTPRIDAAAAEAMLSAGAEEKVDRKRKSPPLFILSPAADGAVENPPKKAASYNTYINQPDSTTSSGIIPAINHQYAAPSTHHHQDDGSHLHAPFRGGGWMMHNNNPNMMSSIATHHPVQAYGMNRSQFNTPFFGACWMHNTRNTNMSSNLSPAKAYHQMMSDVVVEHTTEKAVPCTVKKPEDKKMENIRNKKSENKKTQVVRKELNHQGKKREKTTKVKRDRTKYKSCPSRAHHESYSSPTSVLDDPKTSPPSEKTNQHVDHFDKETKKGYITKTTKYDVHTGRGSGPYQQLGNLHFRTVIDTRKTEYLASRPRDFIKKNAIAKEIVEEIRALGGRFLTKLPKGKVQELNLEGVDPDLPVYELTEEDICMEKTKQGLRQKRKDFLSGLNGTNDNESSSSVPQEDSHNIPREVSIESDEVPLAENMLVSNCPVATWRSRFTTLDEREAMDALLRWKY
ncbi:hypothetical protein QTG54_011274 [Skeletonema marinoi]|uniref:DUF6824 domain-containing protein n=1 Tax=Skeletonema marinoi TaxID=267567 RepID=A0AAD8Y2T5_9STRA|nr:hypothetical protein QTG54_011274 [Skeletonema marinoi]